MPADAHVAAFVRAVKVMEFILVRLDVQHAADALQGIGKDIVAHARVVEVNDVAVVELAAPAAR